MQLTHNFWKERNITFSCFEKKIMGTVQMFEKFVKSKDQTIKCKQKGKTRKQDCIEDEVDEISDIPGRSTSDFWHC